MLNDQKPYSQTRALWAITRASFKAIFGNPSAIIFSILFPIIFVLIFGAFGGGGGVSYRIALAGKVDTSDFFYKGLLQIPGVKIVSYTDSAVLRKDLIKGKLTAILDIQKTTDSTEKPHYTVGIKSTSASSNTIYSFVPALKMVKLMLEKELNDSYVNFVEIGDPVIEQVRQYRQIDFILPGQLGFSILFSTLFGIAFTFFNLRVLLYI